ncbi:TPA: helix-turn-helix transcriptional regulator [Klebsiella pneumoniae]|nr:AraC family transcriptional regulator [Enterobacter hormaechei subsp. xiangfangensis]HBR1564533.1 helix-turn-helix transcriptional regulator [Klebsiella pneumoniae]
MTIKGQIPQLVTFPGDLYFRHEHLPAMEWKSHAHPWGQLNYVSRGVMHLDIDGVRFLSPSQYAVWIPPNAYHFSYATQDLIYRTVYISQNISARLPSKATTMSVSPVLHAVLNDFALRDVRIPESDEDLRMSQVALDQILKIKPHETYLPYAVSDELNSVLQILQDRPGDRRGIGDFAELLHITSRTLERRCQRELGMSFGEWRSRLKFMRALELLEEGLPIQRIALELGYTTPSAFIVMFKRFTGIAPEQYRLTGIK